MSDVCHLVTQVAAALDVAHHCEVRHGELAPREILLTSDDTAKVLAVGRADLLRRLGVAGSPHAEALPYRSPEEWSGHLLPASAASDNWALAVIAYELLTGHHPYESALEGENWKDAVTRAHALPAVLHRSDLSEGIVQALMRALAQNPQERFSSAGEFARALTQGQTGIMHREAFSPDLDIALQAGTPIAYVLSEDEDDTVSRLRQAAEHLGASLYIWRLTTGITASLESEESLGGRRPLDAMDWLIRRAEPTILALLDFDILLDAFQCVPDPDEGLRMVPGTFGRNPPADHGIEEIPLNDARHYGTVYLENNDATRILPALPKEAIFRRIRDLAQQLRASPLPLRSLAIVSSSLLLPEDAIKDVQIFVPTPLHPGEIEILVRGEQ